MLGTFCDILLPSLHLLPSSALTLKTAAHCPSLDPWAMLPETASQTSLLSAWTCVLEVA